MAVYSSLSWVKPSATVALSHVSFQTAWEPDLISTAVQTLFPDVSLALVWRCEGVDVVGQTSVQQRAAPPPPPLPLLFRLYSSLCSPCVQTVPACVYSLHSVSCLLNFCQLEEWDSCVCVSVYHNIALPPEATVHMCVCVSSTVWNHSSVQQYWAPGSAQTIQANRFGRSWPWPVVHISLTPSDFNQCDPLVGSTSTPQLTE